MKKLFLFLFGLLLWAESISFQPCHWLLMRWHLIRLRKRGADHPSLWWDDDLVHSTESRRHPEYKYIQVNSLGGEGEDAIVGVYIAVDMRGKLVYPPSKLK